MSWFGHCINVSLSCKGVISTSTSAKTMSKATLLHDP